MRPIFSLLYYFYHFYYFFFISLLCNFLSFPTIPTSSAQTIDEERLWETRTKFLYSAILTEQMRAVAHKQTALKVAELKQELELKKNYEYMEFFGDIFRGHFENRIKVLERAQRRLGAGASSVMVDGILKTLALIQEGKALPRRLCSLAPATMIRDAAISAQFCIHLQALLVDFQSSHRPVKNPKVRRGRSRPCGKMKFIPGAECVEEVKGPAQDIDAVVKILKKNNRERGRSPAVVIANPAVKIPVLYPRPARPPVPPIAPVGPVLHVSPVSPVRHVSTIPPAPLETPAKIRPPLPPRPARPVSAAPVERGRYTKRKDLNLDQIKAIIHREVAKGGGDLEIWSRISDFVNGNPQFSVATIEMFFSEFNKLVDARALEKAKEESRKRPLPLAAAPVPVEMQLTDAEVKKIVAECFGRDNPILAAQNQLGQYFDLHPNLSSTSIAALLEEMDLKIAEKLKKSAAEIDLAAAATSAASKPFLDMAQKYLQQVSRPGDIDSKENLLLKELAAVTGNTTADLQHARAVVQADPLKKVALEHFRKQVKDLKDHFAKEKVRFNRRDAIDWNRLYQDQGFGHVGISGHKSRCWMRSTWYASMHVLRQFPALRENALRRIGELFSARERRERDAFLQKVERALGRELGPSGDVLQSLGEDTLDELTRRIFQNVPDNDLADRLRIMRENRFGDDWMIADMLSYLGTLDHVHVLTEEGFARGLIGRPNFPAEITAVIHHSGGHFEVEKRRVAAVGGVGIVGSGVEGKAGGVAETLGTTPAGPTVIPAATAAATRKTQTTLFPAAQLELRPEHLALIDFHLKDVVGEGDRYSRMVRVLKDVLGYTHGPEREEVANWLDWAKSDPYLVLLMKEYERKFAVAKAATRMREGASDQAETKRRKFREYFARQGFRDVDISGASFRCWIRSGWFAGLYLMSLSPAALANGMETLNTLLEGVPGKDAFLRKVRQAIASNDFTNSRRLFDQIGEEMMVEVVRKMYVDNPSVLRDIERKDFGNYGVALEIASRLAGGSERISFTSMFLGVPDANKDEKVKVVIHHTGNHFEIRLRK